MAQQPETPPPAPAAPSSSSPSTLPVSTESAEQTAVATEQQTNGTSTTTSSQTPREEPERDEFGLPIRKHAIPIQVQEEGSAPESPDRAGKVAQFVKKINQKSQELEEEAIFPSKLVKKEKGDVGYEDVDADGEDQFEDARSTPAPDDGKAELEKAEIPAELKQVNGVKSTTVPPEDESVKVEVPNIASTVDEEKTDSPKTEDVSSVPKEEAKPPAIEATVDKAKDTQEEPKKVHTRGKPSGDQKVSEYSHQQQPSSQSKDDEAQEEDEWQTMPAYAPYDIYDDDNRLVAKELAESDEEPDAYAGLGGAGRGYTRVQLEEDAQSATSMDDNTQYLFKGNDRGTGAGEDEDEETRDALSQMQATKDFLTEGQKIAYVGMTRLILSTMLDDAEKQLSDKKLKKELRTSAEAIKMWSQKMMIRLYGHMDISTAEQVMIEQLAEHGVVPADLSPTLMHNARIKNPMAEKEASVGDAPSPRPSSSSRPSISSPKPPNTPKEEVPASAPPPYEEHTGEEMPDVQLPSQLPTTAKLDIDLRWTVLCDLFLVLISDSIYDARSRVLLEKVGQNMSIDWIEICKFEKRVTDALEMQQAAEKENWNEDDHKETRRKAALKKRYMYMGLATVGGTLVIGLSAGLLAPLIGAGLAAGFTTIGVAGTGGFLAGAGGAAIITSAAATSGGVIAVRAANRRTGAVKTFEYRPLHNNKRVNLIITVSGWMTGKVDDVRLPYSTVDPIMGDIYSVLWEPEMLRSMGDTINILATEALTQGLQQVLGSTILIALMSALQLPVVLTKLAYLIDNPWTVSLDRANMAGLILADSLIDRNLGTRPITFVGYSLGSRVIFSCLKELARKGAYGLVQNVYLFGSPIVAKREEYAKARSVVAGRFVNGYATNDWILGYLFRLTSGGISRVAGLAPVENIHGIENLNVTELVPGHMAYRTAMPRLLREAGWLVESDEFTEIEDPDPENHAQRQRELINEIEEARKEFEKQEKEKGGKGKFSFFGKKKKAVEKKEWEMYQESKAGEGEAPKNDGKLGDNDRVLFDIEAIRNELANEMIQVRELPSTLPPMKLDLSSPSLSNPRDSLRATQSYDNAALPSNDFKASTSSNHNNAHANGRKDSYDEGYEIPPIRDLDADPKSRQEDSIEMTFDKAFRSPPSRSVTPSYNTLSTPTPPQKSNSPTSWDAVDRERSSPGLQSRPELKSSVTAPAAAVGVGLGIGVGAGAGYGYASHQGMEHNAWADDDEFGDEFGGEKEISMTFA